MTAGMRQFMNHNSDSIMNHDLESPTPKKHTHTHELHNALNRWHFKHSARQDGDIYYRQVPWSWLRTNSGAGCHPISEGCAAHSQCPFRSYCFSALVIDPIWAWDDSGQLMVLEGL